MDPDLVEWDEEERLSTKAAIAAYVGDVRDAEEFQEYAAWLAVNVSELREERGMTIEALARQTGVSERTIYNIARQRDDVRLSTLLYLAEAMEVLIGDLLMEPLERRKQRG